MRAGWLRTRTCQDTVLLQPVVFAHFIAQQLTACPAASLCRFVDVDGELGFELVRSAKYAQAADDVEQACPPVHAEEVRVSLIR